MDGIGNYARHAQYWDWSGHDRTEEHAHWAAFAGQYGNNVLIPFCAWGDTGAYLARRGFSVTAFDITPEMVAEGKKHYGGVPGLRLCEGDVTDFAFDIPPVDFCFAVDFGHILSLEGVKKALVCINSHMREGGGLVVEAGMPARESVYTPPKTFFPLKQVYPDRRVWKTGDGRTEAETGRHYITQTFYAEHENGRVESFGHAFYLQLYSREAWLAALKECGFEIKGEYANREKEPWREGDGLLIIEAVKRTPGAAKYNPKMNLDYLCTPVYRHGNVGLYNDVINLEQPNQGYLQSYKFGVNANGKWVGWIQVKIGYSLKAYYDGQIGYVIDDRRERNKGYATDACLALKPFLRRFGYEYITLTTDEKNAPSRRVCEKIGARLLDIVDTPAWTNIYKQGQRRTCIYEWEIGA